MKKYHSLFFLLFSSTALLGCFWFSQYRNNQKISLEVKVDFTATPLFLNDSVVNKLLTQYLNNKSGLLKDSLDLNMLENQINNTPEVENVEIFIQPQGELSLLITERKPLFKVATQPLHFSDAHGVLFSYKEIDSTPYPVFNASSSTLSLKTTASLIQNLKEDPFMDRELISVSLKENQYELKLKSFDFQVIFGTPTSIENKIQKLKIFCTFQKVQDSLRGYQKINLSYDNQVVATTS